MKNNFYTPNEESLLTYLVERNATYLLRLSNVDPMATRIKYNETMIKYKSSIEDVCLRKPVDYRINVIPKGKDLCVLNLVVNSRDYIVQLKYSDSGVTLPFYFYFDQVTFRKEINLKEYVNDFEMLDQIIDNAVRNLLQKDVTAIFSGKHLSVPNEKTGAIWTLQMDEEPNIIVKVGYAFN